MANPAQRPVDQSALLNKLTERLQTIHGLGETKARELAIQIRRDKHPPSSYSTVEQVRSLLRQHYFADLSVNTQADLQYNFDYHVPRAVIKKFADALGRVSQVGDHNGDHQPLICGSYRRGRPTVNDIDMVMYPDDWPTIVAAINLDSTTGIIIHEPFQRGDAKLDTVITIKYGQRHYNVKVDVFFTNADSWPYTVLFATGNGVYNVRMRHTAKYRGYKLNQYGLYKLIKHRNSSVTASTTSLPAKTEQDIYKHLRLEYHPPNHRSLDTEWN